jgi:hypothetical protein
MPARGLRLRSQLLTLIAVGVLVPVSVKAQGSVALTGTVSETVALSVAPNATGANVVSNGNTVRITLSGTDSRVIRVPLLVRSNSRFKISALFESKTVALTELAVSDVHATGALVTPQLENVLELESHVDPDTSQPLIVASGPRVSLGGTLHSPNNALQITLLIRLRSASAQPWTAQLHLTATK